MGNHFEEKGEVGVSGGEERESEKRLKKKGGVSRERKEMNKIHSKLRII